MTMTRIVSKRGPLETHDFHVLSHLFFKRMKRGRDSESLDMQPEPKNARVDTVIPIDPMTYYLAIDCEFTGSSARLNSIIAVGVYVGRADGKPETGFPRKLFWTLEPMPGEVEEARCMEEFWSQFPNVYAKLTDPQFRRPANVVMAEFKTWCQDLATEIDAKNGEIIIVCDCPDSDLGRLDALGQLKTMTWDTPTRYLGGKTRRSVCDPSERIAMLPDGEDKFKEWLKKKAPLVKHTHFPDDDAEECYWMQLFVDSKKY
jgi:hypothetical protein